jgi:Leucine-rich repeat (LRR) protein
MWRLPKLKDLRIEGTELVRIPETTELGALESLSIRRNRLTSLPDSLFAYSPIRKIEIDKNPWVSFPRCVASIENDLPHEEKSRLFDFAYEGADGK